MYVKVALGVLLLLSSGRCGASGETGGASASHSHLDILGMENEASFYPRAFK